MLSERQQEILGVVIDDYLDSGVPVGSKAIASREGLGWSASTVRAELAALEREGFLTHPHTSAGRIPTDRGYRFYADALLARNLPRAPELERQLDLTSIRREIEDAMRETTAALSQITDLLAIATAPPPSSARIHRVDVLQLQPRVAMVVVIASNGAIAKRVFEFDRPLDPGLVEWAASYLNERLSGIALGARMTAARLADPGLSATEAGFLAELAGAFTELEQRAGDDVYLDGTARLLAGPRMAEIPEAEAVVDALERRANLLQMMRSALDRRSVFVWIGDENPAPELRSVSVVGANYGLGYRNLGTVGVVGPLRMDYETAISSVRVAAGQLSSFFEGVYEG